MPSSPATHRFLAIRIQCNTLLECVLAIIAMQTHAGDGRHAKHNVSENRLQQPSMSAMQCTPKRSSLCNGRFFRPTISRNQHPSSSHAANTNTTTCIETNTCTCMLVYIYIVYIYFKPMDIGNAINIFLFLEPTSYKAVCNVCCQLPPHRAYIIRYPGT